VIYLIYCERADNLKERMYFDSSDFALSAAHPVTDRVTDLGTIQTDGAHPNRNNISHPSSPTNLL
jgi:hypothetical protein